VMRDARFCVHSRERIPASVLLIAPRQVIKLPRVPQSGMARELTGMMVLEIAGTVTAISNRPMRERGNPQLQSNLVRFS
jgi:hypothetical protein